jgi:hypothetical protein
MTFGESSHAKVDTSLLSVAAMALMKRTWAASSTKNVGRVKAPSLMISMASPAMRRCWEAEMLRSTTILPSCQEYPPLRLQSTSECGNGAKLIWHAPSLVAFQARPGVGLSFEGCLHRRAMAFVPLVIRWGPTRPATCFANRRAAGSAAANAQRCSIRAGPVATSALSRFRLTEGGGAA